MKTTFTVRLRHTDAAGVVYFARFFDLAHEAYEIALAESGLPLSHDLIHRDVLLPIVHAEADYAGPLRLGDRVDVEVSVVELGERKFVLSYAFSKAGAPVCRLKTVHVAVSKEGFRATAIPDEVREALQRWSPGA